jgi:preprotein translocase subunit YajC
MGRATTTLFAVSIVLVVLDLECCENLYAQSGTETQIVAPDTPNGGGSQVSESTPLKSAETASESPVSSETLGAPGAGKPKQSFSEAFFSNPLNLVLLAFVAVYLFIFFLPKPGKKEQQALQERLANLKKNDRVVLTSGIHGIVANIHSESGTVSLRVDESSNAKITVDRSAIRSVEA